MSKSVVFIHGAWVTPLCWERFLSFFEERGYQTLAPPWPGKEISIEEQRASPSSTLRGLVIKEIVAYYAALITGMLDQPVIAGHSFGVLFVQLLLERGLGPACVAMASASPQ